MPVVRPGDKLPGVYLDRFQPAENVQYRFSLLGTAAIATESHFIDIPSRDMKGFYQCIQGVCCHAVGRRTQMYNVPIYVYRDAMNSTEGDIMVWQLSPSRWKKFSDLALQYDLTKYDLSLTASKQGYGLDWSYTVVPDVIMRDYWTQEQAEALDVAAESFYSTGEASLVKPMALNGWSQLLYELGFDLQNMHWPGGMNPLSSNQARGAIRGAVSPALPPVPGYTPVMGAGMALPQVGAGVPARVPMGQVGGTLMAPPPLPAAPVPGVVGTVPGQAVSSGKAMSAQVPGVGVAGTIPVAAVPASSGVGLPIPVAAMAPNVTGGIMQGTMVQQVPSPGLGVASQVPLGVAPAMPQVMDVQASVVQPMGVPASQPMGMQGGVNEIPAVTEISAAELDQLIG